MKAEAAHFAKTKGGSGTDDSASSITNAPKRQLEIEPVGGTAGEDPEAKRRRILEETRYIDADSDGEDSDSGEDDT